jgi:hypothetical protein
MNASSAPRPGAGCEGDFVRDITKEKSFATFELPKERTTSLTIAAQGFRPDTIARTTGGAEEDSS